MTHDEIELLKGLIEELIKDRAECTCEDDSTTCYYNSDLFTRIYRAKDLLERLENAL